MRKESGEYSTNSASCMSDCSVVAVQLAPLQTHSHRQVAALVKRMSAATWLCLAGAASLAAAEQASACGTKAAKNITSTWILQHGNDVCPSSTKKVQGLTLAYVTPWNRGGYEHSVTFAHKLSYISPVWLQAREHTTDSDTIEITGLHDIDSAWLSRVRAAVPGCTDVGVSLSADGSMVDVDSCPKIMPRVAWEYRKPVSEALIEMAAAAILRTVLDHSFDGIVLECGAGDSSVPLVRAIATRLKEHNARRLHFVLVLAPNVLDNKGRLLSGMSPSNVKLLAPVTDAFSLMTYDYSVHRGSGDGPNAPLWWAQASVEALAPITDPDHQQLRSKILLGIPFYGYDSGEAILGGRFMELLSANPQERVKYEKKAEEHVLQYDAKGRKRTVHYPTPYFVAKRVELAGTLGCGVSVWEAGQGLSILWDQL